MIVSLRPPTPLNADGHRTAPGRGRRSGRPGLGRVAFWAFTLTALLSIRADLPLQSPRYSSQRFSGNDGLPEGEISQIAQSADGYLWLGMSSGLARFDGVNFDHYTPRNTPALLEEKVTALITDRQGRIWAGNAKGLVSWDRGKFRAVSFGEGSGGSAVTALARAQASDGGLWLATPTAVIRLGADGAPRHFDRPAVIGRDRISFLLEQAGGRLLVGSQVAWTVLDPATGYYAPPTEAPLTASGVRAVLLDDDTQAVAWVLDARGVLRHTISGWERPQAFPDEYAGEAAGLYRDPAGGVVLWVNHWGVFHSAPDHDGFDRLATTNPGVLRQPLAVLRDVEQNLWIATAEGLIRLHQRSAALWGVSQGLPGDMCWSVSSGPDGRLWVGTQAGIGVISGTGMAQAVKGPLATNAVHLVLATRENRVWCVIGDRRVYWSDAPETGGPWHPFPLGDRRVKVLYEDRDGVLWAGTDIGVVKIAGKMPSEIPFEGREHLIPFEVSAIHQDRSGVLWFGTQAGAVLRNVGNDWQRYPASGAILDMHEEGDGGMWFGTTHGVAYCLDQRWREFGPEQGIADQMYLGLYEDAAKHFWLAGPRGLQRVGLPELKAVAAGNTARVFPLNLVELDGVAEYDYAGQRQPGGTLDRLGQLWLPTAQGLLQVDPRRLLENTAPPAAVIIGASFEDLKVDEGAVRRFCTPAAVDETAAAEPEHLRIAGSRGHFVQLRFTANTFLATHQVQFRYRLSPFDQEWQRVAGSRVAIYTNLPAGDYAFEVQAANSQSVWNRRGQIFHFALVPPFYETRWFIVVCALGLLVVILVLARRHYRNNEQRLRGDRLALEQERSRIARDLHDDLGANLTGLAMQAEIAGKLLTGPGAEELQRFAVTTRSLAQRLREVIWAVDPESDTLESLTAFLGQQTDQLLGPTPLRYRFEAPPHLPALRLRAGTRHQLAMSAREAMNNILKYAHANEVKVRIELADDNLSITIRDDGVGLPSGAVTSSGRSVVGGNGLKNIRQRLKSLGGNFRVSNAPGGGTLVRLDVPLAAVTAVESTTENPPNEHQSSDR